VLWANLLVDGIVQSDQEDRYALYKHGDKLDDLCKTLGLPSFIELCDTTDLRYNNDDLELPPGIESTDEVMATQGAWIATPEAIRMLEALLAHIRTKGTRFGLVSNQHTEVVTELSEVVAYLQANATTAQKFNFSVVM
jgi:hypothetical protein